MPLLFFALLTVAGLPSAHPTAFWREIVERGYVPPEGSDVPALADELSALLASPDPELRDEIAYSTLAVWVYQKRIVEPDVVRRLTSGWLANLEAGIGERDTDSVFRRSFSALALSLVVARDNAAPVLTADELRRILDAALKYLAAEQDVRGYEPTKGWMHSAAHTADLLKFVGRSRHLAGTDQTRILDAVSGKLRSASVVFSHGEDERFARAILSLVKRSDFDVDAFGAWATRAKPPAPAARPAPAQLRAAQNVKNLLAKLEVLLSLEQQPSDAVRSARDAIRGALEGLY
jgi:uncharacterized protein DUF2785